MSRNYSNLNPLNSLKKKFNGKRKKVSLDINHICVKYVVNEKIDNLFVKLLFKGLFDWNLSVRKKVFSYDKND
jgi:GTP cyclohydrolase I